MDRGQLLSVPSFFDGSNCAYWKVRMRAFLKSIDERVWTAMSLEWEKASIIVNEEKVVKEPQQWSSSERENAGWNRKHVSKTSFSDSDSESESNSIDHENADTDKVNFVAFKSSIISNEFVDFDNLDETIAEDINEVESLREGYQELYEESIKIKKESVLTLEKFDCIKKRER
ncbi:hypothetical protein CJ030_MR3G005792 [Morella rubra]|uniref:DUF4219 domain-containing protein n=1 Tax=Morella rubra TaxID=262757 RepID=A0A6A1W4E5_9ROSI|nr:hypothetical protein CJ030_MR3G005792 [Morella rubra]